jgi:hypothetical protein
MTEVNVQDVFAELNISRILVAVIDSLGEISIPTEKLLNAPSEDSELEVEYSPETQSFTFKLRKKEIE